MRHWIVFVAFVLALVCNFGCATSIAAQYPHLERVGVCLRVPGVGSEETDWIYDANGRPISGANRDEVARVAPTARKVFEFDPDASRESVEYLPGDHANLTCPEPFAVLPSKAVKEWLPEEAVFFADEPLRCQHAEQAPWDARRAAAFLGQPVDTKSGWFCGARPTVPDAEHMSREHVKRMVADENRALGGRYGRVIGGANAGMNVLIKGTGGLILDDFKEDPAFFDRLMQGLADRLNAIPEPLMYDNIELANIAELAFKDGYGQGADQIQAQFTALTTGCTALQLMAGNIGLAVETAGVKALRLAFARIGRIPIFIPGTVGGAGFFLRVQRSLPKPPPANANAPSLPLGMPPPVPPLPPFGNLSRAAEFRIQAYNQMSNALKGTGLKAHHLIEQRLTKLLPVDPRWDMTVAVTDAEHQVFTNAWRREIAYGAAGTQKLTTDMVNAAARKIYADYPAILKALNL